MDTVNVQNAGEVLIYGIRGESRKSTAYTALQIEELLSIKILIVKQKSC